MACYSSVPTGELNRTVLNQVVVRLIVKVNPPRANRTGVFNYQVADAEKVATRKLDYRFVAGSTGVLETYRVAIAIDGNRVGRRSSCDGGKVNRYAFSLRRLDIHDNSG